MNTQKASRQISNMLNSLDMSEEKAKQHRQYMMDTQPKVKPPKRAFHATSLTNAESIDKEGIKAHKIFGEIYLCDTLEDCLKFVATPCVVYEVDTKKLLPKRWRESLDHPKAIYNCEAYCYFGDIAVNQIIRKTEVFE